MRPGPLPPGLRARPFDTPTATHLGVHPERLRRSDLVRPTRSLRWHRHAPPTGVQRIRAYCSVLLPGQFFSHVTAAVLWGLPVPGAVDGDVHVTSVSPATQMRRAGVVGHRVRAEHARVRRRWGVPASTPAALWVECGALLGLDDLVVLGDAVVETRVCATDLDALRAALDARGPCRGARTLRAALDLVRVGAGSPQETRARLAIVHAGLPEPELQIVVRDGDGRFVARVDMAYPGLRIAIEYEGDHHRTDPGQWAADIRRHRTLGRLGWTVLRWTRLDLGSDVDVTMGELAALLDVRIVRPRRRRSA